MSYGSEEFFETLSYGLHREQKDEETYLCIVKVTVDFHKEIFDKLEKIYNKIHSIKSDVSSQTVIQNELEEKTTIETNTSEDTLVNAPVTTQELNE